MAGKNVIEVNDLSKLYRLGKIGSGSFMEDFQRWLSKMKGKGDPLLNSAVENKREMKGGENIWALKDISFTVQQGDILGIVGRNGAGKSTLLKILSGITSPTQGELKIKGRIASLLEVGTGFHPELSGRENIYLNGTILGMKKNEIDLKFDEIVEFSGVAKYLDTPVKRYSSGMRVRLGFAVAAHLEPEILVVDEVLAVGDAEFQKKAIGKMQEVSANSGRTVLFVSHNMSSLRKLCTRGLLLSNGYVEFQGSINDTIEQYFTKGQSQKREEGKVEWNNISQAPGGVEIKLKSIFLWNYNKEITGKFYADEKIKIQINYRIIQPIRNFRMQLQIHASDDTVLFTTSTHSIEPVNKEPGEYSLNVILPENIFNTSEYKVFLQADIPNVKTLNLGESYISFNILKRTHSGTDSTDILKGYFSPNVKLQYE
jgi:lipopolysaccharide transport system ATP-binding protein